RRCREPAAAAAAGTGAGAGGNRGHRRHAAAGGRLGCAVFRARGGTAGRGRGGRGEGQAVACRRPAAGGGRRRLSAQAFLALRKVQRSRYDGTSTSCSQRSTKCPSTAARISGST